MRDTRSRENGNPSLRSRKVPWSCCVGVATAVCVKSSRPRGGWPSSVVWNCRCPGNCRRCGKADVTGIRNGAKTLASFLAAGQGRAGAVVGRVVGARRHRQADQGGAVQWNAAQRPV